LLHADFLLGLNFKPEDGGDILLQNISLLSADYTVLHTRKHNSSNSNPIRGKRKKKM
jgi:hypothetical protein